MPHLFEKDGVRQFNEFDEEHAEALTAKMEEQGFTLIDSGPLVGALLEVESGVDLAIAAEDAGVSAADLEAYVKENTKVKDKEEKQPERTA